MNKKQFLVIKFRGFLVPIYIKLHPMHLNNELNVYYVEDTKEYNIHFVTGKFDFAKNDEFFVSVEHDERFNQDKVRMIFPYDNIEWFRFEFIEEDDTNVIWSRKYFSEVYGVSYCK